MLRFKRLAVVGAAVAMLAAVFGGAQAFGGTLASVAHRGWTTQTFPHKPKPAIFHGVIRIDVDPVAHRLVFVGLRYNCSPAGGYIFTASVHTKIDAKGNFTYKPSSTHLTSVSGHVTPTTITGSFTAGRGGCKAAGTYSVAQLSDWPPKPKP
jgi:hypothetical protein